MGGFRVVSRVAVPFHYQHCMYNNYNTALYTIIDSTIHFPGWFKSVYNYTHFTVGCSQSLIGDIFT